MAEVDEEVELEKVKSQGEPLLELRNLTTIFPLKRGVVQAVTGVDLTLHRGGSSAWWGSQAAARA